LLAPIVFIAVGGSNELRDLALDIAANNPLAILIYSVILIAGFTFLTMPIDYYSGHVVEHRFGLSRASARSWLSDFGKSLGLSLLLGVAAIEAIYGLIALNETYWWLISAGAFIAFFVVVAQLAPVLIMPLFFKFEPAGEGELRDRLLQLAERFNTRVKGVYIWKLGEKTSKSNAALMGFGPTRRVVVADTMIEANTPDEIEVVLAHELGHHVNRDIPRLIAVQAVVMVAGFAVIHVVLREVSDSFGLNGLDDFANLPLLVLIASLGSLLILPAINWYSRRREHAADVFALEATGRPEDFISAMRSLGEQNLTEEDPNAIMEFVFHSHPSLGRRIRFARTWQNGRA
jgi:STE24 endopeptidase